MIRWIVGPFFSPNCPNSQKAPVFLTDVSIPGMPKDEVAQEDGKRRSMTGTPTRMEASQAVQGQQLAPGAAAQPRSLSYLRGFQQHAGRYGRRWKGHFTGSVNK